ncbi:Uncharacterised protein [Actinomadura madurae]|nr:Uncharacterised protein [Actinomadura madurae]
MMKNDPHTTTLPQTHTKTSTDGRTPQPTRPQARQAPPHSARPTNMRTRTRVQLQRKAHATTPTGRPSRMATRASAHPAANSASASTPHPGSSASQPWTLFIVKRRAHITTLTNPTCEDRRERPRTWARPAAPAADTTTPRPANAVPRTRTRCIMRPNARITALTETPGRSARTVGRASARPVEGAAGASAARSAVSGWAPGRRWLGRAGRRPGFAASRASAGLGGRVVVSRSGGGREPRRRASRSARLRLGGFAARRRVVVERDLWFPCWPSSAWTLRGRRCSTWSTWSHGVRHERLDPVSFAGGGLISRRSTPPRRWSTGLFLRRLGSRRTCWPPCSRRRGLRGSVGTSVVRCGGLAGRSCRG